MIFLKQKIKTYHIQIICARPKILAILVILVILHLWKYATGPRRKFPDIFNRMQEYSASKKQTKIRTQWNKNKIIRLTERWMDDI